MISDNSCDERTPASEPSRVVEQREERSISNNRNENESTPVIIVGPASTNIGTPISSGVSIIF